MPDLAIGCLAKPFSKDDLVRALKTAEDLLRGRERHRPSRPGNLWLYASDDGRAADGARSPPPDRDDSRPSWPQRLRFWPPGLRRRAG